MLLPTHTPPLVLVVDDEPGLRTLMTQALRQEGYVVVTAANGDEALHWLRSESALPALIFTDLRMPVLDGWRLCEELARADELKKIPVVVISSDPDCPSGSVVAQLAKPVSMKRVAEVACHFCADTSEPLALPG